MGPIWGRQDPGGPHVGPMNFAIWEGIVGMARKGRVCVESKSNSIKSLPRHFEWRQTRWIILTAGKTWNEYAQLHDVLKWKICGVTDPLCGEFIGHWWVTLTKASDVELDVFFDLRLNKRLSKQSRRRRWCKTSLRWLWRRCDICVFLAGMGWGDKPSQTLKNTTAAWFLKSDFIHKLLITIFKTSFPRNS